MECANNACHVPDRANYPRTSIPILRFEVPMTDELTATYLIFHGTNKVDREMIIDTMGLSDARFWTYESCDFKASWNDRLGQDRDNMDRNWSGFAGIEQEDSVIAMSMTPIVDRTQEYLVPSDEAVIRLRRRLLDSVAMNENGQDPLGLHVTDYSKVLAVPDTIIPKSSRWQDLATGNTCTGAEVSSLVPK